MTTKSLQGWLLHKQWSGDTSARVIFFTRESGLVNSLFRGGRTPKKQALLQAFMPLWIDINERYDRQYVRHIESISPMLPLEGNALFSGLYVNELLYYALKPDDPHPELFDAYLMTLNGLALSSDRLIIEASLRRFEWVLLRSCGYSFSLTQEAGTGRLISAETTYLFKAGEGFIPHPHGIPGTHLLALAHDNLEDALYLKSAKLIMRQAIDHLLGGREIKARGLYSA